MVVGLGESSRNLSESFTLPSPTTFKNTRKNVDQTIAFITIEVQAKKPELYTAYIKGKTELMLSRRAVRTLIRKPSETELRKLLIKQKGDFVNSNRNDASLRQAQNYAPCAQYSSDAAMLYQCRRTQAISHVRVLNMESRRNSRSTILGINENYAKEIKTVYRDYSKLSSAERKVFSDQLKDRRLASYLEWYVEEQKLVEARRNIRKLTRMPNNKELRMSLIKEKGEFLDSKGNLKKTRRTVVEQQLEHVRSFSN